MSRSTLDGWAVLRAQKVAAAQRSPAHAGAFLPNFAELDCFKQARQNIDRMANSARATLTELAAEKAERIDRYRRDLQAMDWFYAFSESADVWRAGHKAMSALREQQLDLDPSFEIWNSVAPEGCRGGVA